MKTSSAKQKGRKLQQTVRDLLLKKFITLQPDDIRSTGMGQSGEDIMLSPHARKLLPVNFEMKNQESFSIWSSLTQVEKESKTHNTEPILIFKRNKTKPYACISLDFMIDLLYLNSIKDKKEIITDNIGIISKLKSMNIFNDEFFEQLI